MSITAKKNKDIKNFGDTFWIKVRDELRIYVIQEKQPKKQLKLYELGEEDVGVDRKKIKQWSPQTEILINEIMENGYADFICNKDHIHSVFQTLNFVRLQINEIDPELLNFPNLKVLDLNQNLITVVENIPKTLKELRLFSNSIQSISPRLKPCDQLLYLGLGWNQLKDEAIVNISKYFPSLVSLDISNNFFENIELVIENVEKFPKLKMLNAYGNPICLLSGYKSSILHEIQAIEILDNKRIEPADRLSANDFSGGRPITASSLGGSNRLKTISNKSDGINEDDDLQDANTEAGNKKNKKKTSGEAIEVKQMLHSQEFKLRISVQTLENVPEGMILDKGAFNKGEEKAEYFQTSYFCQFDLGDCFEDPVFNKIDSRPTVVERLNRVREQKVKDRLRFIKQQEDDLKKQQELLAQQQLQQQQNQANKKGGKAPPPTKNAAKDAQKVEIPPEIPPVNPNLEGRAMVEDMCKDDEINRLDMQIDFEEILPATVRTRDFFRKGMIVRLYKSEPLMAIPEGGQPEDEKQPKIIPETNLPVMQETLVGLFKIDLEQFLQNGSMPRASSFKYSLFQEDILKIPEFNYPLDDEKVQLSQNSATLEKLLKQQEDAEKPPEPEVADPKKKDTKKKEVKKQDKKVAKKGGKDEPEKKSIPLSTFPQHQRQQVFQDKDHIHLSLRKLQIAALVEIVK